MRLSLIVAVARDGAIGKDNQLLWHLSADLKRFKALTTGHTILMGRNTWLSLPNGALPNRRNVVISRTLVSAEGAEVCASIEDALTLVADEREAFVIGGGEIYSALLPSAQRIYLTEVDATFEGADTYFPTIEWDQWTILHEEYLARDERNQYDTRYIVLERK